jgi:hypothetical protein
VSLSGVRQRLGRRGVPLLILGIGKITWGLGLYFVPPGRQGMSGLLRVLPLGGWALVWVGCGAVAVASAFLPVGRDRWGWIAAVIPPTSWALGYLYGAAAEGYLRGLFVALWYLLSHTLMILWAASVAEYQVPRHKDCSRRAPPLVLSSLGEISWGVGYVAAPAANAHGLEPLLRVMPMRAWAGAWLLAGLVTLSAALLQVERDRWGFAAAAAMPLLWAGAYAWSAVTDGYARGAFVAAWFALAQAGMALWASYLPEWEMPVYVLESRQ